MHSSVRHLIKLHLIPIIIIITIHFLTINFTKPSMFDSNEYLSISKHIFQNHQYSISPVNTKDFSGFRGESPTRMRQPVYPLFLSLSFWLMSESKNFVLSLQLMLNILSYILLYKIAAIVFGDKLFSSSRFLLALYFPFWMLSTNILAETVFSFLLISGLFVFLKALIKNDKKLFFYSGVILGTAFLTRPIALFIILIIGLVPFLYYPKKKSMYSWGMIFIGFILIITPWFLRNVYVLNDKTPLSSDGGYNFYSASIGINEKPWFESKEFTEIVGNGYYLDRNANKKFIQKGLSNFSKNPFLFLSNGIKRVFETWTYFPGTRDYVDNKAFFLLTKIIQFGILLTALIGFIIGKDRILKFIILSPAISFSIVILFSYSISRFLIPVMPFIILLSGQGIYFLYKKILAYKN